MNKKLSLGSKLNIKLKGARKIKGIEIMHSRNGIMFYVTSSSKIEELTSNQISKIYASYIKLGRELYKIAKENDNISKIHYEYHSFNILSPTLTIEKDNIDDDLINIVKKWKKETFYEFTDKYEFDDFRKDSLFLNIYDDNFECKIKEWSKNNIVPREYDSEPEGKFKIDIGRIIDISIFIYLVTYALDAHNEDKVKFKDFIEISSENLKEIKNNIAGSHNMVEIVLEKLAYMIIISHTIDSFEEMNRDILLTKEKLEINEHHKFFLRRIFSCIEGIIWYIFKQYIMDAINLNKYDTRKNIQVNICKKCGATIIGTNVYCEAHSLQAQTESKRKSREELRGHIEELREIFDKYNNDLPVGLKNDINYVLNLKAKEKDKNKRKIDNLFNTVKKWERTNNIKRNT